MVSGLVEPFASNCNGHNMKVLDLQCAQQHCFEGWFGSEADYSDQQSRGLIICPLCGDATIHKLLSAPRLNLKTARSAAESANVGSGQQSEPQLEDPSETPPSGKDLALSPKAMQARLLLAMREVLSQTEDVGERFADQARAMHHGDIEQRSIRGQTTPDVAMELVEEGIEIMPLPQLHGLKETLQ